MPKRLKIKHKDFQGLPLSIENPKGSVRHWYDPHSDEHGTTRMHYSYGYCRRTVGDDDEHVDVYVGPNEDSEKVYIICQNKAPDFDTYDEEKVMLGFTSKERAKRAYLMHYNTPKFFESIRCISISDFKNEYINKAIGNSIPQQTQPMFDPYDMRIRQSVESQLSSIGSMSDKDLQRLVQEVWGDGYEYRPISRNHIRAEMRGFLQDQLEWIEINPIASMLTEQEAMQLPTEMPHESDSMQSYGAGGNASSALLQEQNLDGKLDQAELSNSSRILA